MHKRVYALLTVVLLALAARADAPIVDKANGFKITAPPGWTKVPPQQGAVLILVGPDQGGFRSNINVMVNPTTSLQDYYAANVKELKTTPGAKILSDRKIKAGGVPGYEIIWQAPINGQNLQFYSRFFFANGKACLFTGTSLISAWKSVEPALSAAASSFGPP